MAKFIKVTLAVAIAAASASTVAAEPRPRDATKAPPQQVANFYAGKTQIWNTCNGGGIYYDGGWQAQAYCNNDGEAVGIGTWSISKNGRICHDLTWYWRNGDGSVGSNDKPVTDENCDDIVLAPDGSLWARWAKEKNRDDAWWRLNGSDSIKKGNKLKGKINRMRRKLDV